MRRTILLIMLACVFLSGRPMPEQNEKEIKVLYIGNSLTYVNNLPGLVAEIAMQDKITIAYETYLFPDYSLEDHWKDKKVVTEIEKGNYDYVIAQQGPSALPESQVLLLEYAEKFSKLCKKHHSKFALYMVWPAKARLFDLDNVIYSYSNAAQKTGAILCPAGVAWKSVLEKDSSIALYGPDDFHPGIDGSLLAALTVYGTIASKTDFGFIDLSRLSCKTQLSQQTFKVLKESAAKVLKK